MFIHTNDRHAMSNEINTTNITDMSTDELNDMLGMYEYEPGETLPDVPDELSVMELLMHEREDEFPRFWDAYDAAHDAKQKADRAYQAKCERERKAYYKELKRVKQANKCKKCNGKGRIHAYKHVHGGMCFRCNGDGYMPNAELPEKPDCMKP